MDLENKDELNTEAAADNAVEDTEDKAAETAQTEEIVEEVDVDTGQVSICHGCKIYFIVNPWNNNAG